MKHVLLAAAIALTGSLAFGKTILSEASLKLSPSEIDQVIRLVDKKEIGSSHKKLSIVVTDHGMGTDVSPRYSIYLGYASNAEMGNISVDFKISDQAFDFISAKRVSAGIYEVKSVEAREDGFYNVTTTIDATKVFSDDKAARKACGGSFCDLTLKSSVEVSEKAVLTKF